MDRKQQIEELLKYREKLAKKIRDEKEESNNEISVEKEELGFELVKTSFPVEQNEEEIKRPSISKRIGNIASLAFLTLFLESLFILISIYIYQ